MDERAGARARDERAGLTAWTDRGDWLVLAVGGAAWTVLAYGPNLFWYLSPRHSLLPSIGWASALAAVGARFVSRGGRAAAVARPLTGLLLASAMLSSFHEGTQWVDSRRLRDRFAAAVARLPTPVDSLFLIGAPRRLRRAPAFDLPHDVVMAAGRSLGRSLNKGDRQASPTRRGIIYSNDLTLLPASSFRWMPAAEANLMAFDPAGRRFSCARSLRVEDPDDSTRELPLRGGTDCSLVLHSIAETSLAASIPVSPRKNPRAPSAGGLALLRAEASSMGNATRLEFEWRVDSPPKSALAFVPRIKDASGAVVLDAVFPSRGGKRPEPTLWPLVDDLAAGLRLKPGQGLRQEFLMRRSLAPIPSGAMLELEAFKIAPDGGAEPLGVVTAPL